MDAILKEINAVVGVTGTFVCRADGTLVGQAMPPGIVGATGNADRSDSVGWSGKRTVSLPMQE